MMLLKPGVDVGGVKPETIVALLAAAQVYSEVGAALVVTSCRDGRHKSGSLHYSGHAVDLRTKHLGDSEKLRVQHAIRVALGAQYDVILEYVNQPNEHLHVEFDPDNAWVPPMAPVDVS